MLFSTGLFCRSLRFDWIVNNKLATGQSIGKSSAGIGLSILFVPIFLMIFYDILSGFSYILFTPDRFTTGHVKSLINEVTRLSLGPIAVGLLVYPINLLGLPVFIVGFLSVVVGLVRKYFWLTILGFIVLSAFWWINFYIYFIANVFD